MPQNKYKKLRKYVKVKRFFARTWLGIRIKRLSTQSIILSSEEQSIVDIVTVHLLNKNSKLAIDPVTETRYISSEDGVVHIALDPVTIVLSCSSHYHSARLSSDAVRLIYNKFDRIIESRCKRIDAEIRGNLILNLQQIMAVSNSSNSNR